MVWVILIMKKTTHCNGKWFFTWILLVLWSTSGKLPGSSPFLYGSKLLEVIRKHFPSAHAFGDDTQIYFSLKPESQLAHDNSIITIEGRTADIRVCIVSYCLMINDWIRDYWFPWSAVQNSCQLYNCGISNIEPVENAKNLGSWFGEPMAMDIHIGDICNNVFKSVFTTSDKSQHFYILRLPKY